MKRHDPLERRGAFITVEGVDGAGKSTQIQFIAEWLKDRGIDVVRTREPGGTPLGERIRDILLNATDVPISDISELLMMFAARRQHMEDRIIPALDSGAWVLSDRFTDATYAYQGEGRGMDSARIGYLEDWVQEGLAPDLTVILDVPVFIGVERNRGRNEPTDRFEEEALAFKQRVRNSYLSRADQHPDRMCVVDARGSLESVQDRLSRVLSEFVSARMI